MPEALGLGEFCLELPKEGVTAGNREAGAVSHLYRLMGVIVLVGRIKE